MIEFDGTILVAIISFIIFAIIMNKIFYTPMRKIVDERNSFIDSNISEAVHNKEKSQAILDDKESKLKSARKDARDIINSGVEKANSIKSDSISNALKASRDKIEQEKEKLKAEEGEARNVLKDSVFELSKDISRKLLDQDVSEFQFNQELVNEAMKNV